MSFYPRLFEDTVVDLLVKKLSKIIGKITPSRFYSSTVSLSPENDRVERVGKNKRSDIITKTEFDSFQNNQAKENLKIFLDIKKNISPKELSDNNVTYGEFWDYEFSKIRKTGEFKVEKKAAEKKIELDISEENEKILFDFYEENGKETEFKEFLRNLPSGNKFVKSFSSFITHIFIPYIISKDDQHSDMLSYLYKFNSIEQIQDSMLLQKILSKNTVLCDLYEFSSAGIGGGELLIAYICKDAAIQGGSVDYDIAFNDKNYEIKDYISEKNSNMPIRLGDSSGGKSQFPFYENLIKSSDCAETLINKYDSELKKILHSDVYDLWKKMALKNRNGSDYIDVLGAAIYSGEISKETLNRIIVWHYFASDFINNKYKNVPEEIVMKLSKLKYVNHPEKIKEDFNESPEQYFKNVGNLSAMIIFRQDKIRICGPDDLKFESISQNKFRFIETDKYKYSPSYRDTVYQEYKESISDMESDLSYADFFVLKQEKEHEETIQKRYSSSYKKWKEARDKAEAGGRLKKWLEKNPEPIKEEVQINEKFVEEGDPITDIGIGGYTLETLKKGALIVAKKQGIAVTRNNSGRFTSWHTGMKLFPDIPLIVTGITNTFSSDYYRIFFYKIYKLEDTEEIRNKIKEGNTISWYEGRRGCMIVSKKMFDNRFKIIQRGF